MVNTTQSRFWCFTINSFGTDDVLKLRQLGRDSTLCTYLIFGREARFRTPHLQGYVELFVRSRLRGAKRLIGDRAHLESRISTGVLAAKYCTKEGDFEEFGRLCVLSGGTRTDLYAIRRLIEEGVPEIEIATRFFPQWIQYRKSFSAYRNLLYRREIRLGVRVIIIYGRPGSGKTRLAYEFDGGLYACVSSKLQWFDGYDGHPTVLFDDFVGGDVCASFVLRLLDVYPLQVPIKGGFIVWKPRTIFITSNLTPPFGLVCDAAAFRRRVATIIKLDKALDFTDVSLIQGYMDLFK